MLCRLALTFFVSPFHRQHLQILQSEAPNLKAELRPATGAVVVSCVVVDRIGQIEARLMIVVAKSRVGSVIWTIPLWMQSLVGMKAKHSFQSWSRRSHLNLMPTRYLVTLT